jgi:hypothetical protein
MNNAASLEVSGRKSSIARFVVPEMSLSSQQASMREQTFTLRVAASTLIDMLASTYAVWADEGRAEDARSGIEDALGEAGYPPLAEIVKREELLGIFIGGQQLGELCERLSGRWVEDPVWHWFDELDSIQFIDGVVVFTGTCYSKRL